MTIDKQQTDKLWNWCGFEYHWYPAQYGGFSKQCGWYLNEKFHCGNKPLKNIDNFDRYVIPKLQEKGYTTEIMWFEYSGHKVRIQHVINTNKVWIGSLESLTISLYETIMQVINDEGKK